MVPLLVVAAALAAAWLHAYRRRTRQYYGATGFRSELASHLFPAVLAVFISGAIFLLLAQLLPVIDSDTLVRVAFEGEGLLLRVHELAQRLRVPKAWYLAAVLTMVIVATAYGTAQTSSHRARARIPIRLAAWLKRYAKVLTVVNAVLAIACCFTVFGTDLEAQATEYRARLKQANEMIAMVGSATEALAEAELVSEIIRSITDASPPALTDDVDAAERIHDVDALAGAPPPPWSRSLPPQPIPATTSYRATIGSFADARIGSLEAAAASIAFTMGQPWVKAKVAFLIDLETRRVFTTKLIESSLEIFDGTLRVAEFSPLGEVLGDVFATSMDKATAAEIDRKLTAWARRHIVTSPDTLHVELPQEARALVERDLSPTIRDAWASALGRHAAALGTWRAGIAVRQADFRRNPSKLVPLLLHNARRQYATVARWSARIAMLRVEERLPGPRVVDTWQRWGRPARFRVR